MQIGMRTSAETRKAAILRHSPQPQPGATARTGAHRPAQEVVGAAADSRDAKDQALRRFADATALADQLRREKQTPQELIQERTLLQDLLLTLLDENTRDRASSEFHGLLCVESVVG